MKKSLVILLSVWLFNSVNGQTPHWAQMGALNSAADDGYALFNDTISNTLYVGGDFNYLGGKKCNGVSRWNGTEWDTLQSGMNNDFTGTFSGPIFKILRYKGKVYFFGDFYKAGKYWTKGMAVWNGTQWDSTTYYPDGNVRDADVYNDTLYICGSFTKIGNLNTNCAARFDGTSWYPMNWPYPADGSIDNIRAFKGKVYATGGWYVHGFSLTAEWTQTGGWIPSFGVQGNTTKTIKGLERIDSLLYFYGRFSHISTMFSPDIAAWSGTYLYGFGPGIDYASNNATINRICKIGNTIWTVGIFDNAGGVYFPSQAINVASFTSNQWTIYDDRFDNSIRDITKFGADKIICGGFWTVNGTDTVKKIAKWIGGNYTYTTSTFSMSSLAIGINEINLTSSVLKVYPNPTSTTLHIETSSKDFENLEIEIINTLGQAIIKSKYKNEIDVSSLSQGVYTLKIFDKSSEVFVSKFVKE